MGLSKEQLGLISQVRDEWVGIASDTEPVDRAKIREILVRLYAVADKPAPRNIIHLESPLQISKAISGSFSKGHKVSRHVQRHVVRQVCRRFAEPLFAQIAETSGGRIPVPQFETGEDPVWEQLDQNIIGGRSWPIWGPFGQFNPWFSWCDYIGRIGADVSMLEPSFDLARSCGVAVLFWEWAFISDRPVCIHRDGQNRLHHDNGPAVRYSDGFSVFAIHGIRVPRKLVMAPERLTVPEIEAEINVELRRLMITRYGTERFLMDAGAMEIHRDDFGILYRKEFPEDQSLVMVKVVNSTPEPDGSFKDYFLRVPPSMERARQAVAWTFGKAEDEYAPASQT